MFLPQLTSALSSLAMALALMTACAGVAQAQATPHLTLHATVVHHRHKANRTDALLAALSAEAGIPFFTAAQIAHRSALPSDQTPSPLPPALCLRAGVGLSPAVMSGSQMNLQHGILGCPTETAGLPISVSTDPALQPPPSSRTGEYTVDLSLRYRLLQRKRLQVEASVTDQGLAYGIDRPISGNNLLAAMSVRF